MQTPSRKGVRNPESSGRHGLQCVCEICTCGKHSCPEPQVPFQGDTSYHRDYKPYEVTQGREKAVPYKPIQSRYDPQTIKSTYETNYKPMKIQTEEQMRPSYDYTPNRGKLDTETEYRKNYINNKVEPDRPFTPVEYKPSNTKFEGNTTYKQEYNSKPLEKQMGMPQQPYKTKNLPFQGKSTYQRQYQPHKIEPERPETTDMSRYRGKNSRFEGNSHYKQDYKPYEVRREELCAVDRLPTRPTRCSPGKQHLHYSPERKGWQ